MSYWNQCSIFKKHENTEITYIKSENYWCVAGCRRMICDALNCLDKNTESDDVVAGSNPNTGLKYISVFFVLCLATRST